ncbi:MAG TPA: hypothetical protein VEZ41_02095 [Allosphingosinicella sp.]|nr:hypothetical protein [Allosphingosinicella sp.]
MTATSSPDADDGTDLIMQKLGITKVPAAYFEWGGFRYGRMEDAVAAAKRHGSNKP